MLHEGSITTMHSGHTSVSYHFPSCNVKRCSNIKKFFGDNVKSSVISLSHLFSDRSIVLQCKIIGHEGLLTLKKKL